MLGFLKTVLIILLVLLGLRLLARIAMPFLLRFVAKKANQRFNSMFEDFQQDRNTPDNEAHINKKQTNNRKEKQPVGEYIDYEEID